MSPDHSKSLCDVYICTEYVKIKSRVFLLYLECNSVVSKMSDHLKNYSPHLFGFSFPQQ